MSTLNYRSKMAKIQTITWSPKQVNVKDVKPTPNNYKIKTDLGKERLAQSLKLFGLAGTVVVNTDLSLIDGNSRLLEAKERGDKKIWVSVPNRKLTSKEYQEMSAMYDFAKAGEVDMDRIEGELGTTSDFYKKWGISIPMHLLEGMGAKAKTLTKDLEYPEEGAAAKNGEKVEVSDTKMVQLFFSAKQEKEFRAIEEKVKKKFKIDNTTDVVYKVFQLINKTLK